MEGKGARLGPATIALAAGGVVALLLYLWFLSLNFTSVSGDAAVGQGIATLYALLFLWIVVVVLVCLDRVLGGPSWPRRAGFWLVPLAFLGAVGATDYPNDPMCQFAVLALPLLAVGHPLLGRLPAPWAARAQTGVLLPMAALSVYAIVLFAS